MGIGHREECLNSRWIVNFTLVVTFVGKHDSVDIDPSERLPVTLILLDIDFDLKLDSNKQTRSSMTVLLTNCLCFPLNNLVNATLLKLAIFLFDDKSWFRSCLSAAEVAEVAGGCNAPDFLLRWINFSLFGDAGGMADEASAEKLIAMH
mmetsp:Transcript_24775/g.45544  ORF Transcript_24775/g.45544 Transcript_24775/m.45544 type:complete len:149 (+) Transcript_24775:997-1443(+)